MVDTIKRTTPLGRQSWTQHFAAGEQVPASEMMVYKMVALARVMCPQANIPATTALATINKTNGRGNDGQHSFCFVFRQWLPGPTVVYTRLVKAADRWQDAACHR